jgi:hypothetical protein
MFLNGMSGSERGKKMYKMIQDGGSQKYKGQI